MFYNHVTEKTLLSPYTLTTELQNANSLCKATNSINNAQRAVSYHHCKMKIMCKNSVNIRHLKILVAVLLTVYVKVAYFTIPLHVSLFLA
jgi:hypothetical protein